MEEPIIAHNSGLCLHTASYNHLSTTLTYPENLVLPRPVAGHFNFLKFHF